jgi:hypothetical protein
VLNAADNTAQKIAFLDYLLQTDASSLAQVPPHRSTLLRAVYKSSSPRCRRCRPSRGLLTGN